MRVLDRNRLVFWIIRAHRHLGLVLCPFLLVFAVSTLIFNHWTDSGEARSPELTNVEDLEIPDLDGLPLARDLVSEIGLDGEIDWVRKQSEQGEILILLSKPAQRTEIRVNVHTRRARVETRQLSPMDRILYLHKRPGPHVAGIRGNWWFVRCWRYGADFSAVGMFLLSLTGLYLWWRLPAERRGGLFLLVAGIILVSGIFFLMFA